jgi:hypothetical protein
LRAAGSGAVGTGDLIAIRGDVAFPIEVKATKERRLYLSGRTMTQYLDMQKAGELCGLMPLYAIRLKGVRGDSWRILRVETQTLMGRLRLLSRRIPALPLTSRGTPHLSWEAGLPLHKFLALLCRPEEKKSGQITVNSESPTIMEPPTPLIASPTLHERAVLATLGVQAPELSATGSTEEVQLPVVSQSTEISAQESIAAVPDSSSNSNIEAAVGVECRTPIEDEVGSEIDSSKVDEAVVAQPSSADSDTPDTVTEEEDPVEPRPDWLGRFAL